ncbi:hypothetical protein SEA_TRIBLETROUBLE_71 [Mycobacterium Phage TribleTrouble]|nr:hypothetical protein SEA_TRIBLETROUBLE_71 [Mycobacterium Phage TribleTrouble]
MRRPSQSSATGTDLCPRGVGCLRVEQIGTDRNGESVPKFSQVKDSFKSFVYRSTDIFKLVTLIQDSRVFRLVAGWPGPCVTLIWRNL